MLLLRRIWNSKWHCFEGSAGFRDYFNTDHRCSSEISECGRINNDYLVENDECLTDVRQRLLKRSSDDYLGMTCSLQENCDCSS